MLAQTHQEEIPEDYYYKNIVRFVTLNNICCAITEHKHSDIPKLAEIVDKIQRMFLNLIEINMSFNRFTMAGFESLIEAKEVSKWKINAKFSKYPGK